MPDRFHRSYKPIADYGVIGNLRTAALVGRDGSIDWCCLPELDRPSVFAAILDVRRGGHFYTGPLQRQRGVQYYLPSTNVLKTDFEVEGGRFSVIDFMPLQGAIEGAEAPPASPGICRIIQCEEGEVDVVVEWAPRFDYARTATYISENGAGFVAHGKKHRLALSGLPRDSVQVLQDESGPLIRARLRLSAGMQVPLVTIYDTDYTAYDIDACQKALEETVNAWQRWAHTCKHPEQCAFGGPWHDLVVRSGLVLKLLTHPDTGAIAAAATTSLPEQIGGVRNWDYRFSWIRDAAFTAQALFALEHHAEALDFINWAEQVSMAEEEQSYNLQIMYGLHGEDKLPEIELDHLEGYKGSRPVRIGNAAAGQRQLDIYGELLNAAYELVRMGGGLSPELMSFLAVAADEACKTWREPDYGIWEIRGGPRHFVYSKVMVWVALDRAVRMAEQYGLQGDAVRWRKEREVVRQAVLSEGYDEKLGAFVQAFDTPILDASALLIPLVEFLPCSDPRVQGTIDRILERLTENGMVYRYLGGDGLPGGEGAFGLMTFWMVQALALGGRHDEAFEMFEGMARRANHVGLYAEEIDPKTGHFLGNFPQAFTHIGLVNSALYLARLEGRHAPGPAPLGSRAHGKEAGHDTDAAA